MKRTIAAATALALTTILAAPAFAEPTVAGLWEQSDSEGKVGAWFLFEKKDDSWVGRLVKGFRKPGDKFVTTCEKCPGERKGARMMGLTIVYDMKRDGLHYDDGMILDPRDGTMYHALMDLSPDGKELSVRGYVMMKMLGQTQVWHRLPDDAMKGAEIPKELLAADLKAEAKAAKVSKHDAKTPKHEKTPTPEAEASPAPADSEAK